jgi:hypothetical protein
MSWAKIIAAAADLSAGLGGAEVTVDVTASPEALAALGREIRAGLDAPGGLDLTVTSLTIVGDPPRAASVTVTAGPAGPAILPRSSRRAGPGGGPMFGDAVERP